MSEDDISRVMDAAWAAVAADSADPRDKVLFELYRQRAIYREALQRIAAYPYKGWTQQVAEKALEAVNRVPGAAAVANKEIEAAVDRGLAATALDDVSAGAEMMCKNGVPLEVSQRVLLHPALRRASDWRSPGDILSVHPEQRGKRA